MSKKQKGLTRNNKNLHNKFKKDGKSNASTNPDRKIKGNTDGNNNSLRSTNTIKRLKMYEQKMPDLQKMHKRPTQAARVDPNRKWFGNVRTIDQRALEKLRIQITKKEQDPTKIFVKAKKIPTSLLEDPTKQNKIRLLEVETYKQTFGPQSRRKKAKLSSLTLEQMAQAVENKTYDHKKDFNLVVGQDQQLAENRDKRMSAGQSKRIWDELYKVIDCSDVIVQVLDARDPQGTRSLALEEHLKKNCPHKHLMILINKADLIPVWVLKKWVQHLSKQYPTIAFKASITNPFGKGSLINVFRQFDIFHRDKKNISIGFVGYPNVGKSSVINCLKEKKVCRAAPVPGETKVWQYITLTKRIYLIDCPGTVHNTEGKDDVDSVLKGCVRAERIDEPTYYIQHILAKIKRKQHLIKHYGVKKWQNADDFITQLAIKKGKLKKGGEPDVSTTAKLVLIDWQRGELPYYTLPEGQVDNKIEDHNLDNIKEEQFLQQVGGIPQIIDVEAMEQQEAMKSDESEDQRLKKKTKSDL